MSKVNWFTGLVVVYLAAIILYSFKDNGDYFWGLYHNYAKLFLMFALIAFGFKKEKNKLDVGLVLGIAASNVFTAICFQLWYNSRDSNHPFETEPNIFCIIVVGIFILSILIINKIWKR